MRKWIFILLILCSAGYAQATSVTLQLKSVSPENYNDGSVYVYPYYFSINGSPVWTKLVCDDFLDEITVGESWTANVNYMADILGGAGQMDKPSVPSGVLQPNRKRAYEDAAWLTQQLVLPAHHNNSDAVAINHAIWALFADTHAYFTVPSSDFWFQQAEAQTLGLSDAEAITKFGNVVFYTPSSWTANASLPNGGRPQEFLGTVPEPSSLILLAAGMLVVFIVPKR